jgi:hypothetical protein
MGLPNSDSRRVGTPGAYFDDGACHCTRPLATRNREWFCRTGNRRPTGYRDSRRLDYIHCAQSAGAADIGPALWRVRTALVRLGVSLSSRVVGRTGILNPAPHRAVCLESNPSLRDGSLSGHRQSSSLRTDSFDYTDISTLQAERQFSFAPTSCTALFRSVRSPPMRSAIYNGNCLHLNEPFRADQSLDYHERADRRSFGIYKASLTFRICGMSEGSTPSTQK